VFNAPDPAAMVISLRQFATAHGSKWLSSKLKPWKPLKACGQSSVKKL
jgi:hypothetical protein